MSPDHESATAVLAAILVRPSTWPEIADALEPDCFDDPRLRAVAEATWAVRRRGEEADILTVGGELDRRGSRGLAGGTLVDLVDAHVPSGITAHVRRVREFAAVRRLLAVLDEVRESARRLDDGPVEWLEEAARKVTAAADIRRESELVHVSTLFEGHIREIQARAAGPGRGVSTGIAGLDTMTGGLHPAEYTVVAARPSAGKSALGLQIATHVAQSEPVAFFSSEMKRIPVMDRVVSCEAQVGMFQLRHGRLSEHEMSAIIESYKRLKRSGAWISDRRGWRVNEIVAQVRSWKATHCAPRPDGTVPKPFVIVDYLQRIHASRRHSTREQEVAEISDTFATMAGELNVSLMVLAQLNRGLESRDPMHPPQLSDLRESGAIEQDADGVWFVHRPDRLDPTIQPGGTMLVIAKQRQGECGIVPLEFQGKYQRFVRRDYELDRRTPPKTTRPGDKMR